MTAAPKSEQKISPPNGSAPALVVGVALILCAMWMLVWRGSLDGVFHFDDYGNIVDNHRIRRLWPLDDFLSNNRPIGLYSFAINYHFSGAEPFSYHVVNLAIHVVNGLLLFTGCYLTARLWRTKPRRSDHRPETSPSPSAQRRWSTGFCTTQQQPDQDHSEPDNAVVQKPDSTGVSPVAEFVHGPLLIASLISTTWVVHPLTTQAVTNVVQRYESLASLGYLGAWVGLLVCLCGARWLGCAMILPAAWIGLMSKEVFATAPLVILMFDRLVTQQPWLTVLRLRWLPYLLMLTPFLWFVPSVVRFFDPVRTQGSSMGLGMKQLSSWEYLRTQPEVIWHYLGLVVWPKDLCFDYLWRIQNDPKVYLSLGAGICAALLIAAGCYLRHRTALAGWLGLTFFLILAPTSSVMPIADLAVEHRMYLASAVMIAGIALTLSHVAAILIRNSERPAVLRAAFACILFAGISLLAWRTHLRNQDYRDGLVLWMTAARISPENPRAWYNVGRELYNKGDKQGALRPMISAVGFSETSVPLFDVGLADSLREFGRNEDAITLYLRAIAKKAFFPEAHNNLGAAYLNLNRLADAQRSFRTAVEQNHPEAKYNLALVYLKQNQIQQAIPLFEEVIELHPEFSAAVRQLAWILATAEDDRLRDIKRASDLMQTHYDPNTQSVYVLDTLGAIQAAQGDFAAAIQTTQKALTMAQGRDKPNAALIADLQQRIQRYQDRKPWIGGSQP